MPKIRVLHFVVRLSYGGIETWLSEVLSHYDRSRFQMDVCCIAKRPDLGELADRARQNGAAIHYLPINQAGFFFRLVKLLRGNYDVVEVHFDPLIGFPLLLISWLAKVPVRILSIHSTELRFANKMGIFRSWLVALTTWLCSYVTGCSQSTLDALYRDWRKNPKYQPLYLGIDIKRFSSQYNRNYLANLIGNKVGNPVIGHIGRFTSQKNHPAFISMAHKLVKILPNVIFILIGDGQLRAQIEKLVVEMNLSCNIYFLGARSDVPQLLNSIDVLYFPSSSEGFPVTFLEAQSVGVPLVTGTRPELIEAICPENVSILTLDTSDPELAAHRINELLSDQELWKAVSQRGQDWVRQNFSIEQSTRRLEEIILSGLPEASAPASEAIL